MSLKFASWNADHLSRLSGAVIAHNFLIEFAGDVLLLQEAGAFRSQDLEGRPGAEGRIWIPPAHVNGVAAIISARAAPYIQALKVDRHWLALKFSFHGIHGLLINAHLPCHGVEEQHGCSYRDVLAEISRFLDFRWETEPWGFIFFAGDLNARVPKLDGFTGPCATGTSLDDRGVDLL